jgi:hypothetical protein
LGSLKAEVVSHLEPRVGQLEVNAVDQVGVDHDVRRGLSESNQLLEGGDVEQGVGARLGGGVVGEDVIGLEEVLVVGVVDLLAGEHLNA